jgi:hypothetical protein
MQPALSHPALTVTGVETFMGLTTLTGVEICIEIPPLPAWLPAAC